MGSYFRGDSKPSNQDELDRALREAIGYYARPDIPRIRDLLKRGADPNRIECDEKPPLHLAVTATDEAVEATKLLLEAEADIHATDDLGTTALYEAASIGCADVVRLLFEHGARVENSSEHPAHIAAIAIHHTEVLRILLNNGIDPSVQNELGTSLLHFAAAAKSPTSVRLLLERGADSQCRNLRGETPLDSARMVGSQEIINILSGKDVGPVDEQAGVEIFYGTQHWDDEDGTFRINKRVGPTGHWYTKQYISGCYNGYEFPISYEEVEQLKLQGIRE